MSDTYESMWDESDDDIEFNENELPELDNNFKNLILNTKRRIYAETIFSGEPETRGSQDIQLTKKYLKKINKVYSILKNAENNNKNISDLSEFNEDTKKNIIELVEWVYTFFRNNSIPDTIPYTDYIKLSLYVYPYVQNNNFDDIDTINNDTNDINNSNNSL